MSGLACDIPISDRAEFGSLRECVRVDVRKKLRAIRDIMACREENIRDAVTQSGRGIGLAYGTMRRYYDNFRHSAGDWRVLIDKRMDATRWNSGRPALPAWLIALWQRLVDENNRKMEPAHRKLIRLWHEGYIPPDAPEGARWPEYDPATRLPMGCSMGNLRTHRPTDFELMAMRHGLGAALGAFGPMVLTTRVGLYVGSHFMIDDVKRDMEFLLLGHGGQRVVPLELGVLDLFSGDRFAVHRRPQYRRPDGVKDGLKEREMRFLLASVFRNIGYSTRGTEIPAELGTAAVRSKLAAFLREHSGGKITVRDAGITGREQAIAGFYGQGGGNPRNKPHLESHHNLIHNEAADLLAAVGRDRNPPEWLHGLQCVTDSVLKWMRELPPERAALLRTPHLEWWQGCGLLSEIDERIRWRTDHDLEGWIECGHTRVEYCADLISDRWIGPEEFVTLPTIAQERLVAAGRAHRDFIRARKLAPREVFSRGMKELVTLPDEVWALMFCDRELGDDLRMPRPKRLTADGLIALQDAIISPSELFFERTLCRPDGGEHRLDERTDYAVAFNPFDLDRLWVYDTHGAFLGTAPRRVRASRLPERAHEITSALGARAHEKSLLTAPLGERNPEAARLIADIQEHNRAVTSGSTADERRETRRLSDLAEDVLADLAGPTS